MIQGHCVANRDRHDGLQVTQFTFMIYKAVNAHTLTHTHTHVHRTSFYYNPALQSRSFLMLGVVTQKASTLLVTKTLKVLEDTMLKHEDDVLLLEAIVISLTMMVPLLDEVCEVRGC